MSNYYAEFQTDKYILETFFPNTYHGIMVEVGAGPTTYYSMSKAFREKQWRTICVEPNPYYVNLHKLEGNEIYDYAISNEIIDNHDFEILTPNFSYMYENSEFLNGISCSAIKMRYNEAGYHPKKIIKVNITTLDWLLNKLNVIKIDFVSIDVEGWELEVMKGFNTNYFKPFIILLENTMHDNSYTEYMNSINYSLVHKIEYNYIYKNNSI